jgi:hypothetical protein
MCSLSSTGSMFFFPSQVVVFYTTARLTALFAEFYKKLGVSTLEIYSWKSVPNCQISFAIIMVGLLCSRQMLQLKVLTI